MTLRFISEDPFGWASGQSNAYAYVGGDPVDFIDPLGLFRNPDYGTISIPIAGPVSISVTVDRAGNVYGGAGVGAGGVRGGFGIGVGWTGDQCTPNSNQLQDFLGGWGANAGIGIGVTWSSPFSPGNGDPARLGPNLQTPGAGVGYNWGLGNLKKIFR